MFDKLNFYGKNNFTVGRIFKFMEVVMFKWQKKVLSLLVMMFMFSAGVICGAIEDYLIYFGCQETNCSKCKKSLACKDCISNFPAVLLLACDRDRERGLQVGKYKWENYCFIPFERDVRRDINVEEIYQNKAVRFCGNCMLEYFADRFHEAHSHNFINFKKIYKQYVRHDYDCLNESKEYNYKNFLEKFSSKAEDFPFPVEFVNYRVLNSYLCRDCHKLFLTSIQSLISENGCRICPSCESAIDERYEELKKPELKKSEQSLVFLSDYHNLWLRTPCITGGSILNRYEEKYIKVENSKKSRKVRERDKKTGIKHEEQKK